ncbi:MAG: sigma-70 family RNA polymerase sigma factor [Isosphaeraceae bacterium]
MASGRSGMALRQIGRLFDEGTLTGLTDGQLLDRFVARRDEGAFAILVERHGPMVLAVCRGVLKDMNDAEDAFQATFLVLFRKAGGLRSAGSLASWLYRVAYRIAIRANALAARRRERSWEDEAMAAEAASSKKAEADPDRELLPMIHQEIDRLPDRYRAPIALCYLEGLSYEDVARQLGWPIGTVGSRLARARELLKSRLARRGVTATSGAIAALLAREAAAAPTGWVASTTRAAMGLGSTAKGAAAAGAVSAAVALSDQILRRMLMIKLIQATVLLTTVASAGLLAWTSIGAGDESKRPAGAVKVAAKAKPRPADDPDPKSEMPGKVPIRGRVIAPDGKPVPDASIYLGQSQYSWNINPMARTDAEGRFRFELDPEKERRDRAEIIPRRDWTLEKAELTAVAPGYGAAWSGPFRAGVDDVELRLVPDDVPLLGRVLDMQGRPIPGVIVRVGAIYDPPAGDLDALLEAGTIREGRFSGGFYTASWATTEPPAIETGPDGRFRIVGAGRDRLVLLEIDGTGIEQGRLWAMTRPAPPSARSLSVPSDANGQPRLSPLHGATFDHVAGPSKPIEGVVRLKGTDRPLAGVHVSAIAEATGAYARAITDKQGHFRLNGLPKVASYRIQANPKPGQPYLARSIEVTDTDGLKPIPVTFELRKGVAVRGRLIDKATGKGVGGEHVYYMKLPSNANEGDGDISSGFGPKGFQMTISSGFGPKGFQMTVPPGPAIFYADAAGEDLPYTRARLSQADRATGISDFGDGGARQIILSPCHTYRIVDVPADAETFTLDMDLTRGATRKGRLIGPDGMPLAGVIAYGLAANWQVKTLGDATFEALGLEPGKARTVSFIDKARRLAGAILIEPGDGPVEVRLAPCGAAVGRLVDMDGQPLAGATINLGPEDHRGEPIPGNIGLWPEGEVFTADKDGRFRVEGINPDLSVHVAIHPRSRPDVFLVPEKSREAMLEHLKAKPGETVDLGEIRLSR